MIKSKKLEKQQGIFMSLLPKLLPGIESFFRITDIDIAPQNNLNEEFAHTFCDKEVNGGKDQPQVNSKQISKVTKTVSKYTQILPKEPEYQVSTSILAPIKSIQSPKIRNITQELTTSQNQFINNNIKYRKDGTGWTKELDNALIEGMKQYPHQWSTISENFLNNEFTKREVRVRYEYTLNPELKKGAWTFDEDSKLTEAVQRCNLIFKDAISISWKNVAKQMGNRSVAQCQARYKILNKRQEIQILNEKF